MRHQTRQKRGGGHVLGESALLVRDEAGEGVAEVLSREPTPEEVAGFADDYTRFLDRLKDPALRSIALRRLDGQSTQEIARALNVSTKTIDRKLQVIRAIWSQDNPR
jgi:DNA-directed RNA polymerase specialized sigma24 family protein